MEPNEIMKRLNEITKAEFELNWNLGEVSRVVLNDSNRDAKHVTLSRELERELNADIREGYVARVGILGTLTILKKEGDGRFVEVKRINSEYSKYLPYGYVMGRKLPKSAYREVIAKMA